MTLGCKEAARLLSEQRDRRLSWRARIALRFHMLACKMCQIYGAQLGMVSRICNEAGMRAEDHCPECLSDERKRRMKDALARDRES
jgi:hypothetical protein